MLQLDNETPFRAALAPLADEDGVDALFVIVKATFTMRPKVSIAPSQIAIARTDLHMGEPGRSSLIEAGEHHLGKAGTDVVMHGCARQPDGRPAPTCAVSIGVAERSKSIVVHGDRQWRSFDRASAPQPFVEMPLVWERAFGGSADGGDKTRREISAWNPVGIGLDRTTGAPVPNLEDPAAPVEGGGGRPRPVAFAPIAPGWRPRCGYAGTYDDAWVRRRSPLLPTDFDKRFFNVAASELAFDRFLVGGEPVTIVGVSAAGPIRFSIPACELAVQGYVAGSWRSAPAQLETVALWPDEETFSLSWRAKLPCDRTILKAERVHVAIESMPAEVS